MDKRTITIILAVVLIGCFFLPYLQFFGKGASGYDIVTARGNGKEILMQYIWILLPLSGLMLLLGAMNHGNYILGRSFWIWLAVLTCVFVIVKLLIDAKGTGESFGIGEIFKVFGLGFWISLGVALIVALFNPRSRVA
jgi:hypothetical protein